jgi:hypothetical protein
MMKSNRFFMSILVMALVFGITVFGCDTGGGDNSGTTAGTSSGNGTDGIQWESELSGTLTTLNNSSKDMIIFQGQTPNSSTILGGVRANNSRVFDISDDVPDFDVGGYMILRGISKDEYEAHKNNLSVAKIEYSAMATYKQGTKYRTEISPSYTGDYGYKVTNSGRIGLELRKNSPDGEKIGYLPSLKANEMLYTDSPNSLAIFPVYVYYTRSTGQITTLKPTSHFDSVTVTPRPLSNATSIQSYYFPNDTAVTWDQIRASLTSPVAYFTVSNVCLTRDFSLPLPEATPCMPKTGMTRLARASSLLLNWKAPQPARKNIL